MIIEEGSVRITIYGNMLSREVKTCLSEQLREFTPEIDTKKLNEQGKKDPNLFREYDEMTADPPQCTHHSLDVPIEPAKEPNYLEEMHMETQHLPRLNPANLADTARYSVRMRALEEIPAVPATMQTEEDAFNAWLNAQVNEVYSQMPNNGRRCSSISGVFDAWERNAKRYKPSCLSQALQALDREFSGDAEYQPN